jgi:gamma-glutamylcyclotransferase (GGCT)/AIG2-like uncharacterized protein YtfP
MSEPEIAGVFVYGTLMQGQVRAKFWPRKPISIEPATILGELYDVGPYPAILHGDETIGGELWRIAPADLEETLVALDRVEGFGQGGADLYVRREVQCRTLSGESVFAFTYYLADESAARRHARITPGGDGVCRWR